MVELELSRPMRVLVEEISGIDSEDEVLVITDEKRYNIAKALANASRSVDATTVISVIPLETRGGVEPPEMVAGSMKDADYAFVLTSNNITHTDAHRNAQEEGTEISSMWGANEDLFTNGPSPENYEAVDEVVSSVKEALRGAKDVRITCPRGTDLSFSIAGRPAIALGIKENDKSDVADFPQGEVAVAPVEGSATGEAVISGAMDSIGLVDAPIVLTFDDGYLTSIEGDEEARELQKLVDDSDENAGNLAEFAIGANEDARLVENMREAKKQYGTIHVAIGDNNTIGGEVKSNLHLDGLILEPTVFVDGDKLVENGNILV